MKFACDKCQTKYSLADDRVKGRVLKIRCKACGNTMSVTEQGLGGDAKAAQPMSDISTPMPLVADPNKPASSATQKAAPAKKGGVNAAIEEAFGAAEPAQGASGTMVSPYAGKDSSKPHPVPVAQDWYVSTDGNQDGPFSIAQAKERATAEKRRGKEVFVWKAGFGDWLPVHDVPDFREPAAKDGRQALGVSVGKAAPPLPADASIEGLPTEPVRASTFHSQNEREPTGKQNTHAPMFPESNPAADELNITEPSQVVNLSLLRQAAVKKGATAKEVVANGAPAPAATAGPVGPKAPAAPSRGAFELARVLAIGGGVMSCALIIFVVVLLRQQTRPPEVSITIDSSGGGGVRIIRDEPVPVGDPGGNVKSKKSADVAQAGSAPQTLRGNTPRNPKPPGKGPATLSAARDSAPSSSPFDDDLANSHGAPKAPIGKERSGGGGEVSQASITNVINGNKRALQRCYEASLKQGNAAPRKGKVQPHVKVGISGSVTAVSIVESSAGAELDSCIVNMIKKWRFPSSGAEYETEFSLMLQANNN